MIQTNHHQIIPVRLLLKYQSNFEKLKPNQEEDQENKREFTIVLGKGNGSVIGLLPC